MICLRYAYNRVDAEDMLQEGLIGIFKDIKQFDPKRGPFYGWANRVIINAALQYLRKWNKLKFTQDVLEYENDLSNESTVFEELGTRELLAIVQKLPTGYRTVFNLNVIEGYKHREIAEILNISENTSKSQLSKAKKMLRDHLTLILQD